MRKYTITGRPEAIEILKAKPHQLNVLCLYSPRQKFWEFADEETNVRRVISLAKNVLAQCYFDLDAPLDDMRIPEISDVEHALEFARGHGDLLVCCHAGVSRSSANAYVIASDEVGPEKALEVLDPNKHWPNRLIVEHGAKILGKPEMIDLIKEWEKDSFAVKQVNALFEENPA